MNSSTPAISIDGVVKTFGTVTAVDGPSLEIHPGEVVAFLTCRLPSARLEHARVSVDNGWLLPH